MEKRTIQLGDYDTAAHGLWTLAAWSFPEPAIVSNLVQVPGRAKGPLDLSTTLTDGEPTYGARELSVTLESSEGTRLSRDAIIADMVARLHGRRMDIVLPDHPDHYVTGRLMVQTLYSDLAHASVQVTGTCEPWLYAKEETVVILQAATAQQAVTLRNSGGLSVVPIIEITAESGSSVILGYGSTTLALSPGTYAWPELLLTPGDHELTYSGSGTVTITYREAVLK